MERRDEGGGRSEEVIVWLSAVPCRRLGRRKHAASLNGSGLSRYAFCVRLCLHPKILIALAGSVRQLPSCMLQQAKSAANRQQASVLAFSCTARAERYGMLLVPPLA